jgi:hypothetical protein
VNRFRGALWTAALLSSVWSREKGVELAAAIGQETNTEGGGGLRSVRAPHAHPLWQLSRARERLASGKGKEKGKKKTTGRVRRVRGCS